MASVRGTSCPAIDSPLATCPIASISPRLPLLDRVFASRTLHSLSSSWPALFQQTRGEGPGDPKSNLRCCQLSTVCPCILLASETSCRDQGHAPNEPRLSGAHGGRPESDRTQR